MNEWPVIVHRIIQIGRRIHYLLLTNSKNSGFSGIEHHVMMETYRLGSDCSYEDVIRATMFDKSTVSRIIVRLEQRNCMYSYSDPSSPYRKRVRLTEQGKGYAMQTIKEALGGEQVFCRVLTAEEKSRLHSYLLQFYNQLRENCAPDVFSTEWPVIGHCTMNTIKYIVRTSPVFSEEGRDANQKWILMSLLHQGGTSTYKKIEKKYLIEQTVVVRQMRKLAAKGLVGKSMSGRDKRVKEAWLTAKGKEEAEKIRDACMSIEKAGCCAFSKEGREDFSSLLYKVLKEIDSCTTAPPAL